MESHTKPLPFKDFVFSRRENWSLFLYLSLSVSISVYLSIYHLYYIIYQSMIYQLSIDWSYFLSMINLSIIYIYHVYYLCIIHIYIIHLCMYYYLLSFYYNLFSTFPSMHYLCIHTHSYMWSINYYRYLSSIQYVVLLITPGIDWI